MLKTYVDKLSDIGTYMALPGSAKKTSATCALASVAAGAGYVSRPGQAAKTLHRDTAKYPRRLLVAGAGVFLRVQDGPLTCVM